MVSGEKRAGKHGMNGGRVLLSFETILYSDTNSSNPSPEASRSSEPKDDMEGCNSGIPIATTRIASHLELREGARTSPKRRVRSRS